VQQPVAWVRRLSGAALALLVLLAGLAVAGSAGPSTDAQGPGSPATALGWDTAGFPTDGATARTGRAFVAWPSAGDQPAVAPEPAAPPARGTSEHTAPDAAVAEPAGSTSTRQERAPPAEIG
jgi:hypothetical protein